MEQIQLESIENSKTTKIELLFTETRSNSTLQRATRPEMSSSLLLLTQKFQETVSNQENIICKPQLEVVSFRSFLFYFTSR